jgi:hypothetical protein
MNEEMPGTGAKGRFAKLDRDIGDTINKIVPFGHLHMRPDAIIYKRMINGRAFAKALHVRFGSKADARTPGLVVQPRNRMGCSAAAVPPTGHWIKKIPRLITAARLPARSADALPA